MRAYKFLAAGGTGRFSDFRWPAPTDGEPGEWVDASGPLEDCRSGVHACAPEQLLDWIDDELWEIELGGDVTEGESMLVAERGRLVERVAAWDAEAARAFADACAWRARDFAIAQLRRIGLTEVAADLVDAVELRRMQAAAVRAHQATEGDAAELAGYAADTVALAEGRRPEMWGATEPVLSRSAPTGGAIAANLAHVVAHAAGRDAVAATGREDAYADGFAAERARQLEWLRDRCGI